jgi:ABC-2 type transport system permease protein
VRGGAGAPLRALAELRLRLVLRRLRGRGGVPEVVARLVLWAVVAPMGLLFGAGAGAAAYRGVRDGVGLQAALGAQLLFYGVWQAWTVVGLSLSDRDLLDLRRFLGYPIPAARVYAYGLVSSVIGDPFALFWSLILLGAFVGAALARPGAWLALLALVHLWFVAGLVTLLALLQELLARAFAARRARVVAVAAVYVALGFALSWASRVGTQRLLGAARAVYPLRWVAYPQALAGEAAVALYAHRTFAAVGWLAGLVATTALTAWAAYGLALAGARGGGEAPGRGGGAGPVGWRLPGRLGPLLEKEGKYLLRHPLCGVLALVLPGVAGFVGWRVVPFVPAEAGDVVRGLPLIGFAAYVHLATQALWLNTLGWDRGGARVWFLAPVPLADVLQAKNLALLVLGAALFAVSAAAMIAASGLPAPWALTGAAVLHLALGPWLLAAGNVVSVLSPQAGVHTVQRGARLPAISMVAGMLIVSTAMAVFGAPVLLAVRLEAPWLLVGAWAALGIAGAAVLRWSRGPVGRLLAARREAVLAAVAGDIE